MLHIPSVLNAEQVAACRTRLASAGWADGRMTAGYQSARAKHNLQLPETDPAAEELGAVVRAALERNPTFLAAAAAAADLSPALQLLSRRRHLRQSHRQRHPLRRTGGGASRATRAHGSVGHAVPLLARRIRGRRAHDRGSRRTPPRQAPAGDLVLYSATTVHRVEPITRGARTACFFWLQSLVRSSEQRSVLFDLDVAIQKLERDHAGHSALVRAGRRLSQPVETLGRGVATLECRV